MSNSIKLSLISLILLKDQNLIREEQLLYLLKTIMDREETHLGEEMKISYLEIREYAKILVLILQQVASLLKGSKEKIEINSFLPNRRKNNNEKEVIVLVIPVTAVRNQRKDKTKK